MGTGGINNEDRSETPIPFTEEEAEDLVNNSIFLEPRYALTATTITNPNGDQIGLFVGGNPSFLFGYPEGIYIFDGNNDLERSVKNFTNRENLASASLKTNNAGYGFFAGGRGEEDIITNDVNVFIYDNDNQITEELYHLSSARSHLQGAAIQCDGFGYALFAGGNRRGEGTGIGSTDMDIFKCNDDGIFKLNITDDLKLTNNVTDFSSTSINFETFGYAFFAGGDSTGAGRPTFDSIDIFIGNDDGVFKYNHDESLKLSHKKSQLTSCALKFENTGYALFANGVEQSPTGQSWPEYFNDVDIFKADENGISFSKNIELSKKIAALTSCSLTSNDGLEYALIGGGVEYLRETDFTHPVNDVNILVCNENGVFFDRRVEWHGQPRTNLASFSIKCNNIDYGFFGGGHFRSGITVYNDVDIFDSHAMEFL